MNCMAWTRVLWSTGFLPSIAAYIAATRITSCIAASRPARAEHFSTLSPWLWNALECGMGLKTVLYIIELSSFQRDSNSRIQKQSSL
jgi:hypothetical protein